MIIDRLNPAHFSPYDGPGVYSIHCKASGTVVDLTGGGFTPRGQSDLQGYSPGDQQPIDNHNMLWQIADIGNRKVLIFNYGNSKFISAKNGPEQHCVAHAGAPDELHLHWKVEELPHSSAVRFRSVKHQECVLDLLGGSPSNGTPLTISLDVPGNPNQIWYLRKKGAIAR